MNTTASCNSCRAPILWTTSFKTGKPSPLNPEPVENGNIEVMPDKNNPSMAISIPARPPLIRGDALLYVSHFSTCPQSKDWRGKKR